MKRSGKLQIQLNANLTLTPEMRYGPYNSMFHILFIMSGTLKRVEQDCEDGKNLIENQLPVKVEGDQPLKACLENIGDSSTRNGNRPSVSRLQSQDEDIQIKVEENFSAQCIKIYQPFPQSGEAGSYSEDEVDFAKFSRRSTKYKRSNNNSYKKFCSVARAILLSNLSLKGSREFKKKYAKYRSSRTYFFIILIHMEYDFTLQRKGEMVQEFVHQMTRKCEQYRQEIKNTTSQDLKKFRAEEIKDIQYSIDACQAFSSGNIEHAIQIIYKRDKPAVVKKDSFENSLNVIRGIESQLLKRKNILIKKEIELLKQRKAEKQLTLKSQERLKEPIKMIPELVEDKAHERQAQPIVPGQEKDLFKASCFEFPLKKFEERITGEDDEKLNAEEPFLFNNRTQICASHEQ